MKQLRSKVSSSAIHFCVNKFLLKKAAKKPSRLLNIMTWGRGKVGKPDPLKLFRFKISIRRVRVECSVSQRYLSGMVCEGAFVLVALSGELPKLGCKEFSGLLASSPRDLWLGRPPPTEPLNEPGAEIGLRPGVE